MEYRPSFLRLALGVALVAGLVSGCEDDIAPSTFDATAPSTVADLRATVVDAQSIRLDWTAPGDDAGSGRATAYEIRYSTTAIDAQNFSSAAPATGRTRPSTAGTAESFTVGGLDDSFTYSFALRTADESGNWSAVSNVILAVALDEAAPGQVTDLGPAAITLRTVTLAWTAPGDNGVEGTATHYLVRYAAGSSLVWDTALPVADADVPAPAVGGTSQECVISGLQPFQTYSFAIRTDDNAGNSSPVSIPTTALTDTPGDETELVEKLVWVYAHRDAANYPGLFSPDFLHRSSDGTTEWDVTEELRIHQRMFRPQDVAPADTPVPADLWLVSITAALTRGGPWNEMSEFYFDPDTNPTGLDPVRWRVIGTDYSNALFFQTQGPTQYQADGVQFFVVVEDLSLRVGTAGKFSLYRWEDLGSQNAPGLRAAMAIASWSEVKSLYR